MKAGSKFRSPVLIYSLVLRLFLSLELGLIWAFRQIEARCGEETRPFDQGDKGGSTIVHEFTRSRRCCLGETFSAGGWNSAKDSTLTHRQVAHGLILRCFFKRWLGLSVDYPLPIMMPPGTLAILRYVFRCLMAVKMVPELITDDISATIITT